MMRFKLTLITSVSLMLMLAGLYLAWTDSDGPAIKQFLFTMVGVLGWIAGNKLVELEERLRQLEGKRSESGETGAAPKPVLNA